LLIQDINATSLDLFNLDDEYPDLKPDEMRDLLLERYGEPLGALRREVRENSETRALYLGITRFLLEDAGDTDRSCSRSALQRQCRQRAYGIIQRSRAWGALVAQRYPRAIRLSIHPQACGSEKLGIHLLETADNWLTPWHGVAVQVGKRFVLMKRHEAEWKGARLVFRKGRPTARKARRSGALRSPTRFPDVAP
jgi:L-tyrosine isonitrile synthase